MDQFVADTSVTTNSRRVLQFTHRDFMIYTSKLQPFISCCYQLEASRSTSLSTLRLRQPRKWKTMSSPSFTGLPAELRLRIYHEFFAGETIRAHRHTDLRRACDQPQQRPLRLSSSLSICRTSNIEATPVFFATITFDLGCCRCWRMGSLDKDLCPLLISAVSNIKQLVLQRPTSPLAYEILQRICNNHKSVPLRLDVLKMQYLLACYPTPEITIEESEYRFPLVQP